MRIEAEGFVAHQSAAAEFRYQLRLPEDAAGRRAWLRCLRASFRPAHQPGADLRPIVWWPRAIHVGSSSRADLSRCGGPSCGLRLCQELPQRGRHVAGAAANHRCAWQKHIPSEYLRASEPQRRALLAGLLDTDGTVTAGGAVQFCVTDRRLADDVAELIVSLGYRCQTATKPVKGRRADTSIAYITQLSRPTTKSSVCTRKALLHKERRAGRGTARSGLEVHRRCAARRQRSSALRRGRQRRATCTWRVARWCRRTTPRWAWISCGRARSSTGCRASSSSLEMSKSEIVMRLLSAEAKIKLADMRSGRMSDDDWTRLARRMSEISEAPLYIDDSPNLTMMEIRAKARRLKQKADLQSDRRRLPAADDFGQEGRVAPAGSVRILAAASSFWRRSSKFRSSRSAS